MQATPTLWQALVAEYPERLQGLNVLIGGEALPTHLANTLKELGCTITNLYGPTETTIWSTVMNIDERKWYTSYRKANLEYRSVYIGCRITTSSTWSNW